MGSIAAAGLVMQRDQLRAQNAHVQQVVQQEALRELPVIIGFRKPLFGAGKTAEITNVAGVGMAVTAHKIVALIELDDRTHVACADRQRDELTAAAGYKTIRVQSKQKPTEAEIAALYPQFQAAHRPNQSSRAALSQAQTPATRDGRQTG